MFILPILLIFVIFSICIWLKKCGDRITVVQDIEFGLKEGRKVLFVISHPDDECIFFSPTLLYFKRKRIKVHLLCLSTGNFYGQEENRIMELYKSCANFGIYHDDVHCLDRFEDNPKVVWQEENVCAVIKEYIEMCQADAVFTFDGYGVSGHNNHIDTYRGARYLFEMKTLWKEVKFFTLNSVTLPRKYIQVFDIIPSVMMSFLYPQNALIVSSIQEYAIGYRSMLCHQSQLLWFRRLYILFSRYMLINTWSPGEVK